MGSHPVARQKQEALACFLSDDPTTIAIPTTEKVIASPAGKGASTLNKSFLAFVVASVARPDKSYLIGEGLRGDHHGGPLIGPIAGTSFPGRPLGEIAMLSEVNHGLQGGGREFHGGYAAVYYVGYLLALRHGSPEVRKLAARALAACLAVDYLLTVPGTGDVIEIGGRATGGPNTYSAIIQQLWAGEDPKVPKSDAAIACKMFEALTAEERAMLPEFPGGVEDVVAILEASGVVCPAEFEWVRGESDWAVRVKKPRSWFIDKRTGDRALVAASWATERDDKGRPIYGRPDGWWPPGGGEWADWHLTLDEDGLQVHRRPGGEGKPSPPQEEGPTEDEAPPVDLLPRWKVHSFLVRGGASPELSEVLAEIIWQAQRLEGGEVEAEGRLVLAAEHLREVR